MSDEATEIYRSVYEPLGFTFVIERNDDGGLAGSLLQENSDWDVSDPSTLATLADRTDELQTWLRDCADALDAVASDTEEGAA